MKKLTFAIFILILMVISSITNAQIFPLVATAKHRLYIESNLKLGLQLQYFDHGGSDQYLPTLKGYSIDANLKKDSSGVEFLPLTLYRYGKYTTNKDSVMKIDLYFNKFPQDISLYLNIPIFKPGYQKVNIDLGKINKKERVHMKGQIIQAYNISNMVFSK